MLWYKLLTGTLRKDGFELNLYNACIANKMEDGKQCTIAWYVDNNKILHVDMNVVTSVINKIEERFGKMTVTRGKEHVFLGMNIKCCNNGTTEIRMKDYLEEALNKFGEEISKTAVTLTTRILFEVTKTSKLITKDKNEILLRVGAGMVRFTVSYCFFVLMRLLQHRRRLEQAQVSS